MSSFVESSYRSVETEKTSDHTPSCLKKKRVDTRRIFSHNEAMQLDERNGCGRNDHIVDNTTMAERKRD